MNYLCNTISEVHDFIERLCPDLIAGNEHIVLAVSGGPDSIAMLEIINTLIGPDTIKSLNHFNVIVAHLNHSLREDESEQDAQFVLERCQKLGINCIVKRLDINEVAKQTGQSIETAARNARYEFLTEVCRIHNCKYLATAHHADDNAETILHRIIRGTGINGLSGIQPIRYADNSEKITIVRPLIGLTRRQIEKYLETNNITSRNDSSNLSNDYTRNCLRNKLIPEIENSFNPNFKQALNNLGNIAADTSELLNSVAQEDILAAKATLAPGLFMVSLQFFNSLTTSRAGNLLRFAFDNIGMPMADIGFSKIDFIRSECRNEKTRIISKLANNWTAEISNENLIIALNTINNFQPVEIKIPGQVKLEQLFSISDRQEIQSINTKTVDIANFDLKTFCKTKLPDQEIIDLDETYGSLYVAPLKQAMNYQPLGLPGTQTTGNIMTNHKVPQYLRNRIAAIYDDEGIVCIIGHRISDRCKLTNKTQNAALISFKNETGCPQ